MWYSSNYVSLDKRKIMKTFWQKVAGRLEVTTGNIKYVRPLNYETDEKRVIIDEDSPVLNLKNNNLPLFEDALTEYVKTFFASERNWANPITACCNQEDKLVHAISALWLNATYDDFDRPIEFIKRYTNFLKDNTFEEFTYGKSISGIQTLHDCELQITEDEQGEFQETPTAINFTVKKGEFEKVLPRIAFGISDNTAYIYGVQGLKRESGESPEIKKINRSRYAVNNKNTMPEDYQNVYLKQEPYAYISLFAFLTMLKQKGITKVALPSFLPIRYENKEKTLEQRTSKLISELPDNGETTKEKRKIEKDAEQIKNDQQRIQYNITNKFLAYITRMECEVHGIEITAVPEDTGGSMWLDIAKMQPSEKTNPIFSEIYAKIEDLMKTKEESEETTEKEER